MRYFNVDSMKYEPLDNISTVKKYAYIVYRGLGADVVTHEQLKRYKKLRLKNDEALIETVSFDYLRHRDRLLWGR